MDGQVPEQLKPERSPDSKSPLKMMLAEKLYIGIKKSVNAKTKDNFFIKIVRVLYC